MKRLLLISVLLLGMVGVVSAQSYSVTQDQNLTNFDVDFSGQLQTATVDNKEFFLFQNSGFPVTTKLIYPNGTVYSSFETGGAYYTFNDHTDQLMMWDSGTIGVYNVSTGSQMYNFSIPTDGGDPQSFAVNGDSVYLNQVNGTNTMREYDPNGNIVNSRNVTDILGQGQYGPNQIFSPIEYSNANDRLYFMYSDADFNDEAYYFNSDLSNVTQFAQDGYGDPFDANENGEVYAASFSSIWKETNIVGTTPSGDDNMDINSNELIMSTGFDEGEPVYLSSLSETFFNYSVLNDHGIWYPDEGVGAIGTQQEGTFAVSANTNSTSYISVYNYEETVNYPQLLNPTPPDGETYPFYTDNVNLSVDVKLNAQTNATIRWFVNGQEEEVRTVSSDGTQTYSHPVAEDSSYTWNVRVDGFDQNTENRTFTVLEQQSAFYETTQNFTDQQVLVETYSQGLVNFTLNNQTFELQDGINTFPVEDTNFSIRYDLLESEQGTRVENLTFYSVKEEGIIEEHTVDMESGTVNEDLSTHFGQDPNYIDVLIEMEEFGNNQNQRPALNYYNLTYTADEEVRSIGFDEADVALILIALLVSSFAIAILKS